MFPGEPFYELLLIALGAEIAKAKLSQFELSMNLSDQILLHPGGGSQWASSRFQNEVASLLLGFH